MQNCAAASLLAADTSSYARAVHNLYEFYYSTSTMLPAVAVELDIPV